MGTGFWWVQIPVPIPVTKPSLQPAGIPVPVMFTSGGKTPVVM